jgi:N-methylhydantoinase A
MESALSHQFAEDHIPASDVSFKRSGDLRYVGQGYELKIALPDGAIDAQGLAKVWSDFHAAHQAEYGHRFEASPIEIVNIGVSGVGVMPKLRASRAPEDGSLEQARVRTGQCLFRVGGELKPFETVFFQRKLLPMGERFSGPAIILQKDSTTVVPPGASAIVDPSNNILIALLEAS